MTTHLFTHAKRLYLKKNWIFQDSAPSHRAKNNKVPLHENCPMFIKDWPPYSPDLNPLDCCILGDFKSKVNTKEDKSLDFLKVAILREYNKLSLKMIHDIIRMV